MKSLKVHPDDENALRLIEEQESSTIYVTRPELPDLDDFIPYLRKIWASKVLTNGGPFHQELERRLCETLGVKHIALFANCTIGLVTALQALRISGEVITTPYSFVATGHSLLWNGIRPVFVDIDPESGSAEDRSGDHSADHGHHAGALLRPSGRRERHPGDRRYLRIEGHLRRGSCLRRALPRRQRAELRRPVGPEFPRDQGVHHVRRRGHRLPG
jgi:hypothetical protein